MSLEININDVFLLVEATSIAINRKVFTKEEIDKIFPIWDSLSTVIEKHKRKTVVDQLYPKTS